MPDPNPIRADPEPIESLVERWFFESFHGSAVARSTEVWNVVHTAKEDLKRRLDLLSIGTEGR